MHQLSLAKRAEVVHHLVEGAGVRACSRLTDVHKTTISSLLLKLGRGAVWLHNRLVRLLRIHRIECDEMHSFIHTREQNLRGDEPREWGETWLWLATASTAKLIISFRVGETRSEKDAEQLVKDLRGRITTIPELNTDGLDSYVGPVKRWFGGAGGGVNYAQVVKAFKKRGKDYDRYAPAKEPFVTKRTIFGMPDVAKGSTAYVERNNLQTRHVNGRMRRLCLAFSKRLANLKASQALNYVHGNLCRVVRTLRVTPAMQAGLVDHVWELGELMDAALAELPAEPLRAKPLRPRDGDKIARELPAGRGFLRVIDGGKAPPKPANIEVPRKMEQLKLFDE